VDRVGEPALARETRTGAAYARGALAFVLMAVVGLAYAKWVPYYHKAVLAAASHSLGGSILSGRTAAPPPPSWQAAWSYSLAYFKAIWAAMVVGLVLGAGVQALLPPDWLARVLGRADWGSTARAALASVPAMMCTCCAAPVAVGLARSRASTGATLAFWLGNPLLNPATLVFMGFVLGWRWTALRVAVAALVVFGAAYLGNRMAPADGLAAVTAGGTRRAEPEAARGSLWARWLRSLWRLALSLLPEYVVIVAALGAARAWLFPAIDPGLGRALWLAVPLAVAGTLFVIPTAAEIPIVQVLASYGLGPAGVAALLATLPPVSLPSLVMVGRAVPARVLVAVAALVAAVGVLSGIAAAALRF
jgi:uncharacterized membrane protein YraQ (UPF0718 family)